MNRSTLWVAAMVFSATRPALAAVDSFAYVSGVAGDAIDDEDHKNWIDVFGLSVKVKRGPGTVPGTGDLAPATVADSLSFIKRVDTVSPQLMMKATDGSVINDVRFDFVAFGGQKTAYWHLDDATVKSVSPWMPNVLDPPEGDPPLLEQVKFNYDKITYKYIEKNIEGEEIGSAEFTWEDPTQPPTLVLTGTIQDFLLIDQYFVPEPATLALLMSGAIAWLFFRPRGL